MAATEGETMNSRRNAFMLAAVLAATAVTGGVAVTGLTRGTPQPAQPPAAIVQPAQPAPQATVPIEERD
jgi:hypothetical protein